MPLPTEAYRITLLVSQPTCTGKVIEVGTVLSEGIGKPPRFYWGNSSLLENGDFWLSQGSNKSVQIPASNIKIEIFKVNYELI